MDVSDFGSKEFEDTPLLNARVLINKNVSEADVTVENVRTTQIEEDDKLVLDVTVFGEQYAWIMNIVNNNTLMSQFGKESDAWVGKTFLVRLEKTDFGGKRVDCLRVV